jgi:hypothetical protein
LFTVIAKEVFISSESTVVKTGVSPYLPTEFSSAPCNWITWVILNVAFASLILFKCLFAPDVLVWLLEFVEPFVQVVVVVKSHVELLALEHWEKGLVACVVAFKSFVALFIEIVVLRINYQVGHDVQNGETG